METSINFFNYSGVWSHRKDEYVCQDVGKHFYACCLVLLPGPPQVAMVIINYGCSCRCFWDLTSLTEVR